MGVIVTFSWTFEGLNKMPFGPVPWCFLRACFLNHSEKGSKSAVVPSIPNQPIALNPLSDVSGILYQSGIYRRHVGLTSFPGCLSLCPAGVLYFMDKNPVYEAWGWHVNCVCLPEHYVSWRWFSKSVCQHQSSQGLDSSLPQNPRV